MTTRAVLLSSHPTCNTKLIPQEENSETVLAAVLFEKDKMTTLIVMCHIYILYMTHDNQDNPFVLFSAECPHQTFNTKIFPQEENSETVLVAVFFFIETPHPSSNTKPVPQGENPDTVLAAILKKRKGL